MRMLYYKPEVKVNLKIFTLPWQRLSLILHLTGTCTILFLTVEWVGTTSDKKTCFSRVTVSNFTYSSLLLFWYSFSCPPTPSVVLGFLVIIILLFSSALFSPFLSCHHSSWQIVWPSTSLFQPDFEFIECFSDCWNWPWLCPGSNPPCLLPWKDHEFDFGSLVFENWFLLSGLLLVLPFGLCETLLIVNQTLLRVSLVFATFLWICVMEKSLNIKY